MTAYYNEIDPYAAQWLRNLIKAGHIAPGEVDERSIEDVEAEDLKGFTQCHFFAGIGGWSYAARLAGWDDDRPMWTGSCPCQPFSAAGKQRGTSDERHLWPVFYELIRQCQPSVVFGEQVASRLGREWFAGVRADLETLAYAVGGADLCAASVGAPHIRQRLWWVADSKGSGQQARSSDRVGADNSPCGNTGEPKSKSSSGSRLADSDNIGSTGQPGERRETGRKSPRSSSGLGDATSVGLEGSPQAGTAPWTAQGSAIYIPCADGKARRIEPSIEPLAHGVPARVGRLRAYGNAIVPQVATQFIKAVM